VKRGIWIRVMAEIARAGSTTGPVRGVMVMTRCFAVLFVDWAMIVSILTVIRELDAMSAHMRKLALGLGVSAAIYATIALLGVMSIVTLAVFSSPPCWW
jgi:hypothetical protein